MLYAVSILCLKLLNINKYFGTLLFRPWGSAYSLKDIMKMISAFAIVILIVTALVTLFVISSKPWAEKNPVKNELGKI